MGHTGSKVGNLVKGGLFVDKAEVLSAVSKHEHSINKRSRQDKNGKNKMKLICALQQREKARVRTLNKTLLDGQDKEAPESKCDGILVMHRRVPKTEAGLDGCAALLAAGLDTAEHLKEKMLVEGMKSSSHWEVGRCADHTCTEPPPAGKGVKKSAYSSKQAVSFTATHAPTSHCQCLTDTLP